MAVPTYLVEEQFGRDYRDMTRKRQLAFLHARDEFVFDLIAGRFRPSLRIKRVRIAEGVWEMTWAADGRATFSYGAEVIPGQPDIIWRRVGTRDVLRRP